MIISSEFYSKGQTFVESQSSGNLVLHLIRGLFNMSYFMKVRLEGTDPQPEVLSKGLPTSSANHSLR